MPMTPSASRTHVVAVLGNTVTYADAADVTHADVSQAATKPGVYALLFFVTPTMESSTAPVIVPSALAANLSNFLSWTRAALVDDLPSPTSTPAVEAQKEVITRFELPESLEVRRAANGEPFLSMTRCALSRKV